MRARTSTLAGSTLVGGVCGGRLSTAWPSSRARASGRFTYSRGLRPVLDLRSPPYDRMALAPCSQRCGEGSGGGCRSTSGGAAGWSQHPSHRPRPLPHCHCVQTVPRCRGRPTPLMLTRARATRRRTQKPPRVRTRQGVSHRTRALAAWGMYVQCSTPSRRSRGRGTGARLATGRSHRAPRRRRRPHLSGGAAPLPPPPSPPPPGRPAAHPPPPAPLPLPPLRGRGTPGTPRL